MTSGSARASGVVTIEALELFAEVLSEAEAASTGDEFYGGCAKRCVG